MFAADALPRIPLGSSQRSPTIVAGFREWEVKGNGKGKGTGEERTDTGGDKHTFFCIIIIATSMK